MRRDRYVDRHIGTPRFHGCQESDEHFRLFMPGHRHWRAAARELGLKPMRQGIGPFEKFAVGELAARTHMRKGLRRDSPPMINAIEQMHSA